MVPVLRFPGFEKEWEEKSFGELYEKHNIKNDLSFGVDKIISVANMYYKEDANVGTEEYLRSYNVFRLGDIAYEGNKSANYAYGRFVENTIGDGIVSHVFDVYSPISSNHCLDYWKYAINYERIMRPILEKSTIKSTMMTNLIARDFLRQKTLVPSLSEQQTIADCLSSIDELISAQTQKVMLLKERKQALLQQLFPQNGETTPRLRFHGFTGEWEEKVFSEVCITVTPPLKLQSHDYLNKGKYPIVDQSQDMICGWTNDESGVISDNPVIIFGDHTCVLKYIAFPFVQGADGVKILKTFEGYWPLFVYQSFLANPIIPNGYKRHFSDLKEKRFLFPKTLSEQKKIADCLATLDSIITAELLKSDELRAYKKGLMQQLFPIYK